MCINNSGKQLTPICIKVQGCPGDYIAYTVIGEESYAAIGTTLHSTVKELQLLLSKCLTISSATFEEE